MRVILIFLFLAITLKGVAQIMEYIPLPKDTAIWLYHEIHPWRPDIVEDYKYYFMLGDTTIEQQVYKKLYYSGLYILTGDSPNKFEDYKNALTYSKLGYIGGLREDTVKRKIFMLLKEFPLEEYILYDFDVKENGDTFQIDAKFNCVVPTLLEGITSLANMGEKPVLMYVTNLEGEIMQLYGGKCDFLSPCLSLFEASCGIRCFYSEYYPDYSFGDCEGLLDIMKYNSRIDKKEKNIKISQNVNGTQIIIDQQSCNEYAATLYTVEGKEIWQKSFTSCSKEVLNIPEIPTGIYFIRLASESGVLNQKFVRR